MTLSPLYFDDSVQPTTKENNFFLKLRMVNTYTIYACILDVFTSEQELIRRMGVIFIGTDLPVQNTHVHHSPLILKRITPYTTTTISSVFLFCYCSSHSRDPCFKIHQHRHHIAILSFLPLCIFPHFLPTIFYSCSLFLPFVFFPFTFICMLIVKVKKISAILFYST